VLAACIGAGVVLGFLLSATLRTAVGSSAPDSAALANVVVDVLDPYHDVAAGAHAYSLPSGANAFSTLTHLVVVTGHAVYKASDFAESEKDDSWWLEEFQKGNGQLDAFRAHIARGVALTSADAHALLVMSGGPTRQATGPRSEALSYWLTAEHHRPPLPGWDASVRWRAATEEYARDR
jgi:hypothetical protein